VAASLVTTTLHAFADGNSPGHACALGSAPNVGEYDFLCVNSDTVVSTPSGFNVSTSNVNAMGSYLFYRKASGGESSSVTVVTSGNFNTQVSHSRWSGLDTVDTQAVTSAVGSASNTSLAVTTPTLAGTGEFVLAFAALGSIGTIAQNTPVWSSGYTAVTGPNIQASGSSGMCGFVGFKTGAGTAAESPSVTWSGDAPFNRDSHVIVVTVASGGANGVLAGVLPAITSALTGTQTDRAALAGVLPAITSALTGTQTDRATLAGTLPAITAALTGTQTDRAALAGTLPAITSALTAQRAASAAVLAGQLPAIVAALTGTAGAAAPTSGGSVYPGVASGPSLAGSSSGGPTLAGSSVGGATLTGRVE